MKIIDALVAGDARKTTLKQQMEDVEQEQREAAAELCNVIIDACDAQNDGLGLPSDLAEIRSSAAAIKDMIDFDHYADVEITVSDYRDEYPSYVIVWAAIESDDRVARMEISQAVLDILDLD